MKNENIIVISELKNNLPIHKKIIALNRNELPILNIYPAKKNDYTSNLLSKLIDLDSPLKKNRNRYFKRTVDIAFSTFCIILIMPWLVPLIALFIKINSKGPVFFLQKRNKQNGAVFTCIKFRTMVMNDEADIRSTYENDERITTVGRFLRHYHLDEIPQLINVLTGDMSLIGPRPHMLSENILFQQMIKEYPYRNEVSPGITGLSQSLGSFGSTNDPEKIEERLLFDLLYIKHWSVKMELQIILRTLRTFIHAKKKA